MSLLATIFIALFADPTTKLRYQKILYGYFISMFIFILMGLAVVQALN